MDQNAATLSVTSPLCKIPHYLENRLTVDDAYQTLEIMKTEGDEVERELAAQIADLLDEVWREVKVFRQVQNIYELVAGASPTMSPEELSPKLRGVRRAVRGNRLRHPRGREPARRARTHLRHEPPLQPPG